MAKCGKDCMPECQYFTTGGCVSPFNCLYKVEETYSNSATSNTACYAGTSYTEAQPDESESGIRKWYRESVGHEPANYDAAALKAYIAHLEAENAELQEKDIKCADSVDEMIAMCDKCGLYECCGCEHSYTAVQEVKKLQVENVALRERLDKAIEAPCEDGDIFYRFFDCPIEMKEDMACGFRKDKDGEIYVCSAYGGSWYNIKECEFSREAAETRLRELQGGKE